MGSPQVPCLGSEKNNHQRAQIGLRGKLAQSQVPSPLSQGQTCARAEQRLKTQRHLSSQPERPADRVWQQQRLCKMMKRDLVCLMQIGRQVVKGEQQA